MAKTVQPKTSTGGPSSAAPSTRDFETPGHILLGKYRVERVIGEGGMGVVVEATQLDLDRPVALKFLTGVAGGTPEVALVRFEREARSAAKLRGDHVVRIHDVGKLEDGAPYICMELLQGEDLLTVLVRNRRLPIAEAVGYVLEACEGLAEAHVAGVIHRDLKPANLFVSRRPDGRPCLKILDFGISKLSGEPDASITDIDGIIGSPMYMPPEQLERSGGIDHRADIWSLGAILFELLAGFPPFRAPTIPRVLARVLNSPPSPMPEYRHDVPPQLAMAIQRCLEKRPDRRYPTTADLAMALSPFGAKRSLPCVGSAMRIIRASHLAHVDLPRAPSSLPPPPPPPMTSTIRRAVGPNDRTLDERSARGAPRAANVAQGSSPHPAQDDDTTGSD